ncbi:hypothetical protein [Frankia sp. Cr1]|uniref:hypothetical protein n=1 Tax=Frankia sp. Cr1 TaxID=3073931 RepID=UPI002AD20C85|nr:hypothetical protein [Frankia sp. Cr1]
MERQTLALHVLELMAISALAQLESMGANLEHFKYDLPGFPLEHAAISERIENVVEEVRWLRDHLALLTGRAVENQRTAR